MCVLPELTYLYPEKITRRKCKILWQMEKERNIKNKQWFDISILETNVYLCRLEVR